jgi:hypothetical protein
MIAVRCFFTLHGRHPHHRHRGRHQLLAREEPSPDGVTLAAELRALAEVYALMVFYHEDEADEVGFPPKAWAAWMAWYESSPTRPASRSAPPARATTNARAAAAASRKCSTGRR